MTENLGEALRLMRQALELLDAAGEDLVAVHLDLAIERLVEVIGEESVRRIR